MEKREIENIKKAGEIVKQIKKELPEIVKKDKLLLNIAEEIESKIIELGGKPAFPCNLSIDEIAAHYTPSYNDEEIARGLLKVDFGAQIEGFTADTSVSFDLENSDENKKLIECAEECLSQGIKAISEDKQIGEIGRAIQESAEKYGFSPVQNLSGHSIEEYQLHSGISIPNYDNNSDAYLPEGIFACEPFVTTGIGLVKDGKPSGIYEIRGRAVLRDPKAREIFNWIFEEYGTLPFCSRWIVKKFGTRALIALSQMEQSGGVHQFSQLVEKSGKKVAQAENTFFISDEKVEVIS